MGMCRSGIFSYAAILFGLAPIAKLAQRADQLAGALLSAVRLHGLGEVYDSGVRGWFA